ncbi:tetraspanin-31 isoform X2 [Hemicordylus capensis]|nr:tetraspanin-31 isoform X2 [Hemicordylus capensis]XP_053155775.1 tetraspanin-31 isoform X2 [Hemicordylus capensis]
MLFFYMIILGLVFIVQFGVSCSCLALTKDKQESLLSVAWEKMENSTRKALEKNFNCCGLFNTSAEFEIDRSMCNAECKTPDTECPECGEKMKEHASEALKILGGVGLFFSFTEILGVWLAMRYRNQKDPRANPSAFL